MNIQFLKQMLQLLCTKECADRYFDEFDFLNVECFKSTLSKCLGIGIIFGSLLVKVPQIIKIVRNKNVKGISNFSVMMDLFAATAISSYSYVNGFPFSSWGEGVFMSTQSLIIAALVIYNFQHTLKVTTFLVAYASIVFSVISGLAPKTVIWSCQAINTPAIFAGKIIQAYTNYKNGSTGQLSAVTLFLLLLGSIARIFTSIQETGDKNMIIMYCWTTIANAILVVQLLYYWNVDGVKHKINKKYE